MKLSLSEHIKRSKEAVAANKAKGNKHAELFATMYTQPSRFIEEILQNTEDAYARKNAGDLINPIRFKLFPDKVVIHHNGKDFDENDLMSITTFANTTKKNNSEVNLIGKFGIGFKSVFSITEFPEIHCNIYHFKIEDYEVLASCEARYADEGFNTLIILPFKRKSKEECFATVRQGLIELNAFHLLFLKKLSRIEVFDGNKLLNTIERSTICIKKNIGKRIILKTTYSPVISETCETFLVYNTEGWSQKKLPELAFKVDELNENFGLIPVSDSPLFVYFPLKMYSGLNFLIHAPFTTNPLRDYALFNNANCPENTQMLNDVFCSFVSALSEFKKIGFYSLDLLSKLFVKQPEEDATDHQKSIILKNFFNTFTDILRSGVNIPLGNNKFSKIQNVLIPEDDKIYRLLKESDLEKLFQKKYFIDPAICSEEMKGFKNFLVNVLNLKIVDAESFGFRIKVTSGFLEGKPLKWLKEFYKYLHLHQKLWDVQHADHYYSLRAATVILTDRKTFEAAFDKQNRAKIFLHNRRHEFLPVVHRRLLDDENCSAFFNDLGIERPKVFNDIIYNIIPQFEKINNCNSKNYIKKLDKIITAYAETSHNEREILLELLHNTPWVQCIDTFGNKMFSIPGEVYLKNEILAKYFKTCPGIRFIDPLIYQRMLRKIPEVAKSFIMDIGLMDKPRIQYTDFNSPIIEGFDNFINNIDFERSKAFAKILINASENYFQKELVQFLRKHKWVYTKKGSYAAPEKMNISDLSGSYKFNETEKIRFQILMGIVPRKQVLENNKITWQPKLKPEEINLNTLIDVNLAQSENNFDFSALNSLQTNLNFFEINDIELKEYSSAELDNINNWSYDFVFRYLYYKFPEPVYKVETSRMADFVIFKNEELFRYVFSSGKTDLMNHFHFTMRQFVNICKLLDLQEITFLYCINSIGTSDVSVHSFQNPFKKFIDENIEFSGSILFNPR